MTKPILPEDTPKWAVMFFEHVMDHLGELQVELNHQSTLLRQIKRTVEDHEDKLIVLDAASKVQNGHATNGA